MPIVGVSRPTASCNRVVFPAPFGPTRPTHAAARNRKRAIAERPASAVPFAEPSGVDDERHAMPCSAVD